MRRNVNQITTSAPIGTNGSQEFEFGTVRLAYVSFECGFTRIRQRLGNAVADIRTTLCASITSFSISANAESIVRKMHEQRATRP